MNYILLFFINSLFIFGFYVCFREGMIFEKVGEWIESRVHNDYWLKPVYKCPICMASVWGSPTFLLFSGLAIYYLPVYVFCLAGFNYIVMQLISKEIDVNLNE